ncbi:uncharacterized protein COLE_02505 [Cutaneotrichosporon oleaginosum]|nr:hypothetical protein COLE_02505 [Cutaneotrichosporon oleaginosum]
MLLISSASQPSPRRDWVLPASPSAPAPPESHGAPYRDATPVASAQAFLALAEAEISALGLDTCGDEIGRAMVRAAAARRMVYCAADNSSSSEEVAAGDPGAAERLAAAAVRTAHIECMPMRGIGPPRAEGVDPTLGATPPWWPITSTVCVSRNLRPVARINQRNFLARCGVTPLGERLRLAAAETFVGRAIVAEDGERCARVLPHTVMFVQRMDQWNPFHVAEDLITTFLSMLVAGEAVPELRHHRIQMAFLDNFGLDSNRFDGVWERVGALPPRRTRHEPFDDGVCLNAAIHGMYGRTSLLSASGTTKTYACASAVTWAAALYYRHLFGLSPPTTTPRPNINILYVSRARLRRHFNDDVGAWQEYRELSNESEMLVRWRAGLHEMCGDTCEFVDANVHPEVWAQNRTEGKRQIRFATIDPVGYSLETQIQLAGHATLLVGQHGGALGLSLFMPPGRGAVLEFTVPMVKGNQHFQHMAVQLGHMHQQRVIHSKIDVERAWSDLREVVEDILLSEAPKPVQQDE